MTIRSARPEDAAFIARTILYSMRGYRPRGWFDVALGWPEAECLDFVARVAVARAVSMWHVSRFLVAEINAEPAAALCAVPAAGTGPAAWRALEEVGLSTGLTAPDLDAIRRRGAYTRACWVQGGEGEWMIEHVATDPVHRGRGLVQALIAHALDAGRAAGFRQALISFLIGNDVAERAYAKAGFGFVEEKRDPAFEAIIGAPGFRRFVRTM
ncbi:GNAT family N-acetyltransferase [Bradyrhizobium symbiodeficiens]|uniref:GNAT family N-acetyltransferase n=1 Tax=Bradyrhizobium symbiodeficiens TaxID=1404367 RepID=A0ABX5WBK9_9BRAD|nr:GNAT family N-acetyltransferase [Bradyrhizobium symbiodeficiens]QDF40103.1 GNAT family N-acetyltransferase [Bradyrhizobium symbiodeficiens]